MRNMFAEFIDYNDSEKRDIWENGIFVFDTNVLLGLYRYSKTTRNEILDNIEAVKERVWLPHQVAAEYFKNRCTIIYSHRHNYQIIRQEADKFVSEIVEKLRLQKDDQEIKRLRKYINKWITNKDTENSACEKHRKDQILNDILRIFENKVGEPYGSDDIQRIEKEGERRYKSKIPPGYMDEKKGRSEDSNNKFGDLFLWMQIIDYAKVEQKDITFITDDRKKDFWQIVQGKTIGPRYELRRELLDKANVRLSMYTTESFLKESGLKANDNTIREIRKANDESKISEVNQSYTNNLSRTDYYGERYNKLQGLSDIGNMGSVVQGIADQNKLFQGLALGNVVQGIADQNKLFQGLALGNVAQGIADQQRQLQDIGANWGVNSIIGQQDRIEDMLGFKGLSNEDSSDNGFED